MPTTSIGPGGIEMGAERLFLKPRLRTSIGPGGIEIEYERSARELVAVLQSDLVELKLERLGTPFG